MTRKYNFSPSFTLVEIIIVIAILAILAGGVLPGISIAREKAKQTTCVNNLKQIGEAVRIYAEDWDGWLPLAAAKGRGGYWFKQLWPYHRDKKLYECPSQKFEPVDVWLDPFNASGEPPSYKGYISYLYYNGYLWDIEDKTHKLTDYTHPGATILVCDGDSWYGANASPSNLKNRDERHNGGINILFADFHVEWVDKQYPTEDVANIFWNIE